MRKGLQRKDMCLREWQVQLLEREIKPLQYEQERDESVSPDSKG
jgi:hypothetical protein